ncbi:MAG: sugar phosphate isomerase/epimerase [Armatimonadetes bacterium]|nr:sugar phosphate isomerase/epimerase [Armatimonadota bacterium]
MKLAVSMWSYFRTWRAGDFSIPDFIRTAKVAGAEGVELLDFFYKGIGSDKPVVLTEADVAPERAAALEALAETGLPCPIFSVGQNFAKADPAAREIEVAKIRFGVDEALHYGAGVVRVFAGDLHGDLTFDTTRQWIIEGLTAGANYAHEHGVKLALENHGKLAGRGDQVRSIIEDVRAACGHDTLGANPDTGNFLLVNQPSHVAIEEVASLAYMVHFKDFNLGDGPFVALDGTVFQGAAVGEGVVELETCIRLLKESGYDGWLSVEYEGEEDPMTAVPRSLANARRYL